MSKKKQVCRQNVLYCRKSGEWLELAIVAGEETLFTARIQEVSDECQLVMALARQYDALIGPDVSPNYGGAGLVFSLKNAGWTEWWVLPVEGRRTNSIGWYTTARSKAKVFGAFDFDKMDWSVVCSAIAHYMYRIQEPANA